MSWNAKSNLTAFKLAGLPMVVAIRSTTDLQASLNLWVECESVDDGGTLRSLRNGSGRSLARFRQDFLNGQVSSAKQLATEVILENQNSMCGFSDSGS
jgi:hypothetical protein